MKKYVRKYVYTDDIHKILFLLYPIPIDIIMCVSVFYNFCLKLSLAQTLSKSVKWGG